MPGETTGAQPARLFICCFEFGTDEDVDAEGYVDDFIGGEGTFQIVVEAVDVDDAAERCRARLHEIAATNENLSEVIVYASAFIEVPRSDLARGLLVNHQQFGDCLVYRYLPKQDHTGAKEHFLDEGDDEDAGEEDVEVEAPDEGEATPTTEDDGDQGDDKDAVRRAPVFWARWRLYWCETDDHDEDWFVVARAQWEADAFHEDAEGYNEGDASAEFVCFLPDSEQRLADREGVGWPSRETLLACGAEFIPYAPQDGFNELRTQVASGARVVRINGHVYSEGDIVSNVVQREAGEPDA
jgi:hypothetical protein